MMWQLKIQDAADEAREEGRTEVRREFAKEMIANGEPFEKIMRYTHLSRKDIEELMA